jgi:hypothetical protein
MNAKKAIWIALACAAALALAAQDMKISYRVENKALTTSKGTLVEYHSARYGLIRDDKAKKDTLVDYGDFATYEIDHKKKVIGKTTHEDVLRAADLAADWLKDGLGGNEEKRRQIAKKLFGEDAEVFVENVGSEQIAGRTCEKWEITLGGFACRASHDPSLALPAPQDAMARPGEMGSYSALLSDPVLGKAIGRFLDAVKGLEGVPLKSEVVVPIGPITMRMFKEATEVELGPIPESVFELPKGYREEDAGKKMLADLEKKLGKK